MAKTRFRALDGLLLLDKPAGLSSNAALQHARHLLRAEKGGHTGALDPLATGLLPLCLGETTKIAGLLLGGRKAYLASVRLGVVTDTDDADGQVLLARPVPGLSPEDVKTALAPFLGDISQRPPIYSALKQGGEPLYAKARRGEVIDVAERLVHIEAIHLLGLDGDQLQLEVTCGSGTYIRSLARDLGESLGCGGHITALRRTWVEPFTAPAMVTLDQLAALDEPAREALLLPVEAGLAHWPAVVVDEEQARRLGLGQGIVVELSGLKSLPQGQGSTPVGGTSVPISTRPLAVNITNAAGRSLGLGELAPDATLRPRRLFRWASAC